jgi:hypothetical protein
MPLVFNFTTKEIQRNNTFRNSLFQFSDYGTITGSLREQFNTNNAILDIAQIVGFTILSQKQGTQAELNTFDSSSSGVINLSRYLCYNFSSSVSQKRVLDAYSLSLNSYMEL